MNYTHNSTFLSDDELYDFFRYLQLKKYFTVFNWITLCIEFPVICWAIFALCHLVKNDRVAPVYVINLLISDIIQLIGRVGFLLSTWFGIVTSVVFMVCIALERYLLIAHPLWYRCRRTIRHSVLISLVFWVISLIALPICVVFVHFLGQAQFVFLFYFIVLILPFPLLAFFLVATWRALSRSTSVPVTERKRILWILFIVLGNYAVLFIPCIVCTLILSVQKHHGFNLYVLNIIAFALLFLSPLMDAVLYIFMRKDANDTLKFLSCCQRLIGHQEHREAATETENATSV
ncbi:ovarian cancer G-protein coupled receptor 1-like [Megalops cyprinoides]|uniref:ovarian cancer G-protein coupled receptor 1-like n=1 Tax=Megalops cyprinoides TaxID=118141 RepID=UPI001864593E|nr:ovarian cancer G-protein coupled receptor 1-like [Megalops cyprinoides]